MSEYMKLVGTEAIQIAANTMRDAAGEMGRAASSVETVLQMHQRFMDDWLARFRYVLDERTTGGRDDD